MKIKDGWFVLCSFCMPFIGFVLGHIVEHIWFTEDFRKPVMGYIICAIASFASIVIGIICLKRTHNKNKLLEAMSWTGLIINLTIFLVIGAISRPGDYYVRIEGPHPQRRFPLLPPPVDGWTIRTGDYIVIDLAGGPEVSSYPVTNLTSLLLVGWTDAYKTTKLVLRKIPKGTYTMGGYSTDYPWAKDTDLHTVTITKDFYIGVFEVTQRQWELVMGNRPSFFTNASCYASRPVEQVSYYEIRENPLPMLSDESAGSDDPAVSWPLNNVLNATSFMGKLRARTGLLTLDLPTEAQWEYACKAGTTTALNTGYNIMHRSIDAHMDVAGRYRLNGVELYGCDQNVNTLGGTAKVGSYLPNTWGLYDMHGNVEEWCLDWYGTYTCSVSDPVGVASESRRVIRGGSWSCYADNCRVSIRSSSYPEGRHSGRGFRVSCALP